MGEVDRLSALQVGVARHRPVEVVLGDPEQRLDERSEPVAGLPGMGAREQGHVGGHLVVARAGRVQLAPHGSGQLGDPPLDGHVDVLIALGEREPGVAQLVADLVQRPMQLVALGARR